MQYLYLCPICLALALLFLVVERMERPLAADVVKGLASASFALLGLLGALRCADVVRARWVVAGLAIGAVADVLIDLRHVYEGRKGEHAFLAGIVVFLLGHLAYLMACLPYCEWPVVALVLGVALSGVLVWQVFPRTEATPVFRAIGLAYLVAISILNAAALVAVVSYPSRQALMFLAGALLFLLSDVIHILNNFGPQRRAALRVGNLMLYYVAQLLIALSLQLPL